MSFQSRREAFFDDAAERPERVYAQWISGDAFAILGVKPALGRLLAAADDQKPGQHPVAVLSYDLWSRRFGRNPAVLGRWLTLQDKQFQIVGVSEKKFPGVEPGYMTDLWVPNMMWNQEALTQPGWSWFRVWGRLQPGVTTDQARAVLQTVFTNFRHERAAGFRPDEPRDQVDRFLNTPLYLRSAANGPSGLRQRFERPLWVLGLVVGLVLLIACSNVATLLIAQAAARDREMAVRMSIGAGRGRLLQQVLVESGLLSAAACLLGALLAVEAAPLLVGMLSTSQSLVRLDLRFDWRMFAFLATAGSITTFLFGLAPAFRASGVSPHEALQSGAGRQTARIGLFRPLLAAQTAFSFVVLFVASLFLASFDKLARTDLGFDRHNLAILDVGAPELRRGGEKAQAVWRQLLDRIREIPGIQSASASGWGLFSGSASSSGVRIPGRAVESFESHFLPVSPRFLETMRIRLLAGRDFDPRDAQPDRPTAAIVNESFVRRFFPGESPLGRRFFRAGANALLAQDIIGIAADAKYDSLREAAPPTVYTVFRGQDWGAIQVRTSLDPAALAALVRDELPRVHPALRMTGLTLQSTLVDNTVVQDRLLAMLSGFFALVAVVLAGVGLYGVLSYSIVQRTREIGIRLALGARPLGVAGLVVSQVAIVTAIGLGAGLAGGIFASRFIRSLLYEVRPSDFWSLAGPLVFLLLACVLSALPPALRATRIDPMTALRYE